MSLEEYIHLNETSIKLGSVILVNPITKIEIDLVPMMHIAKNQYYEEVYNLSLSRGEKDNVAVLSENMKLKLKFTNLNDIIMNFLQVTDFTSFYRRVAKEFSRRISTEIIFQGDSRLNEKDLKNWFISDIDENNRNKHFNPLDIPKYIGNLLFKIAISCPLLIKYFYTPLIARGETIKILIKKPNLNRDLYSLKEKGVLIDFENLNMTNNYNRFVIYYGLAHIPFLEKKFEELGYRRDGNLSYVELLPIIN